MLLSAHLLIDSVLEFKVSSVLDGEAGLLPVVDDDTSKVDVIDGTYGELGVYRLRTDSDWDVSDQFSLLSKVNINHLQDSTCMLQWAHIYL